MESESDGSMTPFSNGNTKNENSSSRVEEEAVCRSNAEAAEAETIEQFVLNNHIEQFVRRMNIHTTPI